MLQLITILRFFNAYVSNLDIKFWRKTKSSQWLREDLEWHEKAKIKETVAHGWRNLARNFTTQSVGFFFYTRMVFLQFMELIHVPYFVRYYETWLYAETFNPKYLEASSSRYHTRTWWGLGHMHIYLLTYDIYQQV